MKKFQIIKGTTFPYDIMVASEVSSEQIEKRLSKKYGVELTNEQREYIKKSALAHTIKLSNRSVLIYFVDKPTPGIIAHEAFHATWMILGTMGAEPHVASEEIYAYLIEYIVNKITN